MAKLKILQITNRIPWPLNDGGNIATWNVTHNLIELGHEVVLASLNTNKHYQDPNVLEELCEVHTTDINTDIKPAKALTGIASSKPYNVYRFWSEAFASQITALLKRTEFDVVQLEGSYLSLYIDTIRQCTDAKIVLRSHNVEHQIWDRLAQAEKNIAKRTYLKNLTPKIRRFEIENASRVDGIIAITSEDQQFYSKVAPEVPVCTVNAGVDLSKYDQGGYQPRLNSIYFLGSLEWQPNVQGLKWFLDEIWPDVYKNVSNAEFHIAGKNPDIFWRELKRDGVVFHGEVPDAVEYARPHGIMVVPLLSGGGMRLKVVEAMAMGKCVVSTEVGAEGIRYTDRENIFIASDAKEMISMLQMLLDNSERVGRIGDRARELAVENYSWPALVKQIETFYEEVLEIN